MLILSRKAGQAVHIGNDIVVRVLDYRHGQVRIGFEAPKEMHIVREELVERDAQAAQENKP